jgi:hypothetical protein
MKTQGKTPIISTKRSITMNVQEKTCKKPWEKPELCILVRHKPEEAVLATCKALPNYGGPFTTLGACTQSSGMSCVGCNSQAGS